MHLSYPTVFFTWSDVQLSEEGVEGRGLGQDSGRRDELFKRRI